MTVSGRPKGPSTIASSRKRGREKAPKEVSLKYSSHDSTALEDSASAK